MTLLIISLSFAAMIALLGYVSYPTLEKFASVGLNQNVGWIVETKEKMFEPVSATRVTFINLGTTLTGALVGLYLSSGFGVLTAVFTLFLAAVGYLIPRIWVQIEWKRRLIKFDMQLIDSLNLMANSLKSGLNINQVISVVVEEMPIPLSQEFGLVLSQQKIGLTLDEALEKMGQRVPSEDLNVAIHSILILRETGGDLAETFETIANTIRERRKVEGKIQSLTQQGKTQGLMLFLMPFGLAGVLYYLNPGFLTPLFTTQLGWMMLIVMFVFQIIGGLWIKKIVTIEV